MLSFMQFFRDRRAHFSRKYVSLDPKARDIPVPPKACLHLEGRFTTLFQEKNDVFVSHFGSTMYLHFIFVIA